MSNERLDKLLNVMLEMKDELGSFKEEMGTFREEVNMRLDQLEEGQRDIQGSIDLLVKENWNNKRDIHRVKTTMGME